MGQSRDRTDEPEHGEERQPVVGPESRQEADSGPQPDLEEGPELQESAELRSVSCSLPGGEVAVTARILLEERLRGLRKAVGRHLGPVDVVVRPAKPSVRRHLFEEACELYWNELRWEEISDEERVGDWELTEMIFPGLLALVDALLPKGPTGAPDRSREHRDVARDFLLWLAGRLVELKNKRPEDNGDRSSLRRELEITDELIDLILFRLYSLTREEVARYQRG
ncbi:MAG: hypothetical protein ACE5HP_11450 [Gemmatimonadota bacterium]